MNEFNFFIDSQNLVKLNKKKSNQLNLNQVGIWSNTKQDSWKIKTSGYVCRSMMAPTKRREKTFAALESPNDKFHFSPTRSPHHHYQTECCVLVLKKYIKIWTITTEKFSIRNVHSNGFFVIWLFREKICLIFCCRSECLFRKKKTCSCARWK